MKAMTIGKVARAAAVGVETVRYYERMGLIDRPQRPAGGGFRDYPATTVERIRFIRRAQGLGFSLKEIDELLSLHADAGADCAAVREHAQAKIAEVDAKITGLMRVRTALQELVSACPGRGALRDCSILGSLTDAQED